MKKKYMNSFIAFVVALLPWWITLTGIYGIVTTIHLPNLPNDLQVEANLIASLGMTIVVSVVFTAVFTALYLFVFMNYFKGVSDKSKRFLPENKTYFIIIASAYFLLILITAYNYHRFQINQDPWDYLKEIYMSWLMITTSFPSLAYLMPDKLS